MSAIEVSTAPRNYAPQVLKASILIPGELIVYGFTVYSTNAAAQFLCMFDADTVPANGSAPIFSWPLGANNGVGFGYQPQGRRFQSGIVLANSSTDSSFTAGSADCLFDVQYDLIED